jgi:nitrogenase iron protein
VIKQIQKKCKKVDTLKTIAFYGKGGIGKSTVLSNTVAALANRGKKILQIGCDPKHDSTRLILGGFTQATVLEQLNTHGHVSLDSVMLTGYNGIKCIEAGGPEPGVGCAGRGIIQMLNLLKEEGLDTSQFDYVFFDVLGDVVCGGFAVPMREGYADEVYIVTSGEIAALYAANNIAKGIKRYSTDHGKLGGVIGNGRGTRNEAETIATFAQLIGTEMVAYIPKSELIVQAEFESKTIADYDPNSELATIFKSIASHIEKQKTPSVPKPLNEKELDDFLREYCYNSNAASKQQGFTTQPRNNQSVSGNNTVNSVSTPNSKQATPNSNKACSFNQNNRTPVRGCSLTGAFSAVSKIDGSITIMHSPSGCAYSSYFMSLNRPSTSESETRLLPYLLCTNMQETDVIFGGTKNLKNTIIETHKKFPKHTIFIITACASGIIGDNVSQVVEELKAEGIQLCVIPTDGVMNHGDYYSGVINAYCTIAENFIDNNICSEDNLVNLIGEQASFPYGVYNSDFFEHLFNQLNIKINCRYLGNTNLNQIKNFKKATVSIPFLHDPLVKDVVNFLEKRFSIETLKAPIPVGFEQTAEFTRVLGQRFNRQEEAEQIIEKSRINYEKQAEKIKKNFIKKRTLIVSSSRNNVDWLISTMMDLDVEICKVLSVDFLPSPEPFSTKYSGKIPVETNYPVNKFKQTLLEEKPDFVLTTVTTFNSVPCDILSAPVLPVLATYGFDGVLADANRLGLTMKFSLKEGWRNDEKLFQNCSA